MHRILIVEDDQAISNLIKMNLEFEGYQCTIANDGKEGADILVNESFDLILLDIMTPEINGYELLAFIKTLHIPVIFVTAKDSVEDRIKGLRLGADDYLVKPFQIGELVARVEAVLRRTKVAEPILTFQDIIINQASRVVTRGGKAVYLTNKEFDLLIELVVNKNIALYRHQLFTKVWKEEYLEDSRTLDAHIQRLRKKLGLEEQIKTVFRIGYRLEDLNA